MRIVIVGAGGVGGLVGGLLARAGTTTAFVARGPQLEALRRDGLHVDSPRGQFRIAPVEASDDPATLAPADVVLVAVKGWQVAEIAPRLAPLLARGGFAVPLENGVDSADVLARTLGEERVAGGLCHLSSWIEAPGRIKHVGDLLRVTIGERRGPPTSRVEALAAALRAAKVDVVVAEDIDAAVWQKFLFIAAFGGVGAVTRSNVGVLRTVPEVRSLLRSAMEEIAALARARGVRLSADAVDKAFAAIEAFPATVTASMQRDIQAGRPSELFDQTGAVVRLAEEAGVDVPVNRFLYAALVPQENAARGR